MCTNDEKLLLNCNNNKSKALFNRLIEQAVETNENNKALEHRNKLLEFDRTRLDSLTSLQWHIYIG